MKTLHEIRKDFRRLFLLSELSQEISGGTYYEGDRPVNSDKEDAVIIPGEVSAGEVQRGTVTIHIHFSDIDTYIDGTWREDRERAEHLEALAADFCEQLTADRTRPYLIRLKDAICTDKADKRPEHILIIRLSFSIVNE